MKKIMFILLCAISTIVISPLKKVSARECTYGNPAPHLYFDKSWTYGQTFDLHTSASSCLAENIEVYFDWNYEKIGNALVSVEAYLMEEDEDPNPDDFAKSYEGIIYKRWSYDSWERKEVQSGNLDSAGDQKCELYMKFRLTGTTFAQTSAYLPSDLFRYTICVN